MREEEIEKLKRLTLVELLDELEELVAQHPAPARRAGAEIRQIIARDAELVEKKVRAMATARMTLFGITWEHLRDALDDEGFDRSNAADRLAEGIFSSLRERLCKPHLPISGSLSSDYKSFLEWCIGPDVENQQEIADIASLLDEYLGYDKAMATSERAWLEVKLEYDPDAVPDHVRSEYFARKAFYRVVRDFVVSKPWADRRIEQWWWRGVLCLSIGRADFDPTAVGLDNLPEWDLEPEPWENRFDSADSRADVLRVVGVRSESRHSRREQRAVLLLTKHARYCFWRLRRAALSQGTGQRPPAPKASDNKGEGPKTLEEARNWLITKERLLKVLDCKGASWLVAWKRRKPTPVHAAQSGSGYRSEFRLGELYDSFKLASDGRVPELQHSTTLCEQLRPPSAPPSWEESERAKARQSGKKRSS